MVAFFIYMMRYFRSLINFGISSQNYSPEENFTQLGIFLPINGDGPFLNSMLGIAMQSHSLCATNSRNLNRFDSFVRVSSSLRVPASCVSFDCRGITSCSCFAINRKLFESRVCGYGFRVRDGGLRVHAVDDDSFSFDDNWGENGGPVEYMYSSSDGESSDEETILQPITDVDLPISKERFLPADDYITVAAHRFATLGRTRTKRKTLYGILNNLGLISFSIFLLLLVDQCAWRIVRLPLAPFYLMRPFMISMISVSCVGYICVPLFHMLKIRSMVRKQGHIRHPSKKGTPTMGGLYFVPTGLVVAQFVLSFSSIEVSGVAIATIAFSAIGLLDDYLRIKNIKDGLCAWVRVSLEVAVGMCFCYWLYRTDVSTPYGMKMVVPLPAPIGLVCLGKFYPILSVLCFVSMANGMNITNGLDGLAAGTGALAFLGMSIVVLPICSDLSIFGASMAGACVGFLSQNRYKASIFMGEAGALALGGALAAMASCTGMFLPLFISSGIFLLEALSVIMQASFSKTTKYFRPRGYRLFRGAPLHHHLELCGIKEPTIVAVSYVIASVLILYGAYVGLSSA